MQKHTKIYLEGMGYHPTDFVPCEVCESKAVDIHHIQARGMGGSKYADRLDNLMALCRKCHVEYGDVPELREALYEIHERRMKYKKF